MFIWDVADFIQCLEVVPEVGDYNTSHCFNIQKDGIRLLLSVRLYDGDVRIGLYQVGVENLYLK